ncbi:MAG: YdeI/OmpD-associated family protein, partial [Hyphomicrobiales bacterium]
QRITKISELPPARLVLACVRESVRLNESGVKTPPRRRAKTVGRGTAMPAAFRAALAKRPKALATYRAFTPSQRREYVEWIAEAKRPETRDRRIKTAVAWIAAGKLRNWQYARK